MLSLDNYALHAAANNGHGDVVLQLLQAGADVHSKGDCALRWATTRGHSDVVNILLKHGADPIRANELTWKPTK